MHDLEKNIGATPIVSWYHELMMKLSTSCKTWNFRFLTIYISLNPEQDPFILMLKKIRSRMRKKVVNFRTIQIPG